MQKNAKKINKRSFLKDPVPVPALNRQNKAKKI